MIWNLLLQIKNELRKYGSIDQNIVIGTYKVTMNSSSSESLLDFHLNGIDGDLIIHFDSPFSLIVLKNTLFKEKDIQQFILYLPYTVLPYFSKKTEKCFAVTHFAQTLDGRIASVSGNSKWIGNEQNLVHAHKMRALCDAILVGANTVIIDNPKLNVRHVQGENPRIVVIGGEEIESTVYEVFNQNPILFCENNKNVFEGFEKIRLDKVSGGYDTKEILDNLYKEGLHSVYIEGGARTTSCFLKQNNVDQLQIHISPKILGSGVSGFSFEGILDMEHAIDFKNGKFVPMGEHVMFLGELL